MAQRTLLRVSLCTRQLSRVGLSRNYSSPAGSSVIKVSNIPAPHCGLIRVLSLNRPEARNAISRQLLAELSQHITAIHEEGENGPTRALILASESDASFCAGADLKERATFTQEEYARPQMKNAHKPAFRS